MGAKKTIFSHADLNVPAVGLHAQWNNADDLQAFICKVVSQGVGGVKIGKMKIMRNSFLFMTSN